MSMGLRGEKERKRERTTLKDSLRGAIFVKYIYFASFRLATERAVRKEHRGDRELIYIEPLNGEKSI